MASGRPSSHAVTLSTNSQSKGAASKCSGTRPSIRSNMASVKSAVGAGAAPNSGRLRPAVTRERSDHGMNCQGIDRDSQPGTAREARREAHGKPPPDRAAPKEKAALEKEYKRERRGGPIDGAVVGQVIDRAGPQPQRRERGRDEATGGAPRFHGQPDQQGRQSSGDELGGPDRFVDVRKGLQEYVASEW